MRGEIKKKSKLLFNSPLPLSPPEVERAPSSFVLILKLFRFRKLTTICTESTVVLVMMNKTAFVRKNSIRSFLSISLCLVSTITIVWCPPPYMYDFYIHKLLIGQRSSNFPRSEHLLNVLLHTFHFLNVTHWSKFELGMPFPIRWSLSCLVAEMTEVGMSFSSPLPMSIHSGQFFSHTLEVVWHIQKVSQKWPTILNWPNVFELFRLAIKQTW